MHPTDHHILIVEDEEGVASFLSKGLREEGFRISRAADGHTGLQAAMDPEVDLVLLDVRLPFMNGVDVARALRLHRPFIPILMLTAMDTVEDRVTGLRAGADDYLGKPFEFDELLARIEGLLRRRRSSLPTLSAVAGRLRIDPVSRVVSWDGQDVELTRLEYRLLSFFVARQEETLSRDEILEAVWESAADRESNVVDVYVRYLRKKLEDVGCPPVLESVRGVGYRFHADT
jgi:DNA-binding response OmpR family regulator